MPRMKTTSKPRKTSSGTSCNIAVVVARFNDQISRRLLTGCLTQLKIAGLKPAEVTTVWVPGALEIPVVALKMAQQHNVDAVICLGAVIRGETYHFEVVAQNTALGIVQASMQTGKPIIFGVLTTYTVDQAQKRSEHKGDNKGRDAAIAALEMAGLLSHLK